MAGRAGGGGTTEPGSAGRNIDLNADIGEGMPAEHDRALLQIVTSASIACGGHAGDSGTMRRTVRAAKELSVRIGAHPSYPDRGNFGRLRVFMTPCELIECLRQQIASLQEIASELGATVSYIKPHGALYHDASLEPEVAGAVLAASAEFDLPLMLLARTPPVGQGRPGGHLLQEPLARRRSENAAAQTGKILREGFADRGYRPDGSLIARDQPGALITDPSQAAAQALELAGLVDSLCIHSDTPGALRLAAAARSALQDAGYRLGP